MHVQKKYEMMLINVVRLIFRNQNVKTSSLPFNVMLSKAFFIVQDREHLRTWL